MQGSQGGAEQTAASTATRHSEAIERAVGPQPLPAEAGPTPYSEVASLCPIGAFDSGMGGLSIINELRKLLPGEDIIFFADNGYCPYGGRSDDWLRARSLRIADFLLDLGAKTIVVACNTASAAGLEHLRARHSAPIVGLVPAVKPAVEATRTGTIGVLATHATARGRLLSDVVERFAEPVGVEVVTVVPEGLVEAVEKGALQGAETEQAVRTAIAPMLERGADAIVLGCTHYPFLRPLFEEITGGKVQLIDSSLGVSRQTRRVLEAGHLLNKSGKRGTLTVYTSGDLEAVRPTVQRLAGDDVEVLSADI